MMRGTLTVLAVVLVAQLALAATLHLTGGAGTAEDTSGSLVTFKADAVDAVRITGSGGDTVRIERSDQGWKLPASAGFPADDSQVGRLLSNAGEFAGKLPVARSEAARERFSVGTEQFERRVEFLVDGKAMATLFLGGAAGPGQVYARAAGQDMIYEVNFSLRYAAANAADWQDQSVAAVSTDKIRKVSLPGFTLRQAGKDKGWQLVRDGGQTESAVKATKVHQWMRRLARPDFQAVGKGEPPQSEPMLTYTLVTKDDQKIRFSYYEAGDDGSRPRFYRDGQPWQYRIPAKQVAKLEKLDAKKLLMAGKGDDKTSASSRKQAGGQTQASGPASS